MRRVEVLLRQLLKKRHSGNPNLLALTTAAAGCLCMGMVWGAAEPAGESVSASEVRPLEPGALEFSGVYQIWQREPNLTGKGVQIAAVCPSQTYVNLHPQNDYRFNMNHISLYDADVHFTDGTDGRLGISSHATAVAGVLLGLDETGQNADGGLFSYRGVCPDAAVTAHEFWRFVIVHLYGQREFQADLVTLSFGEMFETWWARAIERMAAEKDVLVVASIGNGAGVMTPSPLYPAAGSNVLGVGVIDSTLDASGRPDLRQFTQVQNIHSSMGPTGDMRCKPDIVAPGTALVPVHNQASGYAVVENWSSISSPIVCGTAALLLQKVNEKEGWRTAAEGGKALVLKSVLMNSARKLPYWHKGQPASQDDHETPLDYLQGAGLLDAIAAVNQIAAGPQRPGAVNSAGWDTRTLDKGAWGYEYAFAAAEPNHVITATLCWNRVYADVYPYSRQMERDADLRLELWGIDAVGMQETLLDYSDSVNDNTEHITMVCDPNFVQYAVRVRFNENAASVEAQRFAVTWSVGPDRQHDDPWWYDLNGDSAVDAKDQMVYSMLNNESTGDASTSALSESLGLSQDRASLLRTHWSLWKARLNRYSLEGDESAAAGTSADLLSASF